MCRHCSGEVYFRNVNIGKEAMIGTNSKGAKNKKKATVPWKKKLLVLDGFQVLSLSSS